MEGNHFEFSNMFLPQWNCSNCFFNVPGSAHNSQIADGGNVYVKLEEVYNNNGGICAVDSVFCKGRRPYLIESSGFMFKKKTSIQMQLMRYA